MNTKSLFALAVGAVAALCMARQAAPEASPAAAPASGMQAGQGLDAFRGYWKQPRPQRPGGPPPNGAGGPPAGGPPGSKVRAAAQEHLLPWVAKRFEEFNAASAAGGQPRTNANQCLPWAVPGIGIPGGIAYGMNIVTGPGAVVFMYELDHQARIAYLDQAHPAGLAPSYFGHSVAHWDGSTLTVDSSGFNDKTEIFDGIAHTTALHVTEKLRINERGQLEDQVTFTDPGAYSAPFSYTEVFERAQPFQEYVCAENNHEAEG